MRTPWTFWLLIPLLGVALPAAAQVAQFEDQVEVRRIVIEVRVTAHDGTPIRDLEPEDFRVSIAGEPVEVEFADWIASASAEVAQRSEPAATAASAPAAPELGLRQGRLLVFLYQVDFHRSRLPGLVRIHPFAVELARSLGPEDRVALAVLDSHLELHADFTDDIESFEEMLAVTELTRDRDEARAGSEPSIADHFDRERARDVTTMSEALQVIGDALEPLPGDKTVVMFGWGVGTFQGKMMTVLLGEEYTEALRSLAAARASVISLDITQADYHSLEEGMKAVSEDTGGFYIKTHLFPEVAVRKVMRALSGHYELTLVPPEALKDEYKVKVRVKRPGTEVMVRRVQFSDPG